MKMHHARRFGDHHGKHHGVHHWKHHGHGKHFDKAQGLCQAKSLAALLAHHLTLHQQGGDGATEAGGGPHQLHHPMHHGHGKHGFKARGHCQAKHLAALLAHHLTEHQKGADGSTEVGGHDQVHHHVHMEHHGGMHPDQDVHHEDHGGMHAQHDENQNVDNRECGHHFKHHGKHFKHHHGIGHHGHHKKSDGPCKRMKNFKHHGNCDAEHHENHGESDHEGPCHFKKMKKHCKNPESHGESDHEGPCHFRKMKKHGKNHGESDHDAPCHFKKMRKHCKNPENHGESDHDAPCHFKKMKEHCGRHGLGHPDHHKKRHDGMAHGMCRTKLHKMHWKEHHGKNHCQQNGEHGLEDGATCQAEKHKMHHNKRHGRHHDHHRKLHGKHGRCQYKRLENEQSDTSDGETGDECETTQTTVDQVEEVGGTQPKPVELMSEDEMLQAACYLSLVDNAKEPVAINEGGNERSGDEEKTDNIVVLAQVPFGAGVKPDHIKITVKDRVLIAKMEREEEFEDGSSLQVMTKKITLPDEVAAEQVKAVLTETGTLNVTVELNKPEAEEDSNVILITLDD